MHFRASNLILGMGVTICDVTADMHGSGVTEIAFYCVFSDGISWQAFGVWYTHVARAAIIFKLHSRNEAFPLLCLSSKIHIICYLR
jgi:hypothetical protein